MTGATVDAIQRLTTGDQLEIAGWDAVGPDTAAGYGPDPPERHPLQPARHAPRPEQPRRSGSPRRMCRHACDRLYAHDGAALRRTNRCRNFSRRSCVRPTRTRCRWTSGRTSALPPACSSRTAGSRWPPRPRWRSGLAPTPPSSRSSTRSSYAVCRSTSPTASWRCGPKMTAADDWARRSWTTKTGARRHVRSRSWPPRSAPRSTSATKAGRPSGSRAPT